MANRKVLFRSGASLNEASPTADAILIAAIDQGSSTFAHKASGTTLLSLSAAGLLTMNGDFSFVPATDDTGTIGADPSETGGDPLGVGSQKRFHLIRGKKIKAGSTITLENSIDITNSADGVGAASTGRIKYESATQALRVSENGGALDDVVLRTKVQTLTNKTFTAPTISDFTSSQHNHQNAAGGGQLDHGLALTGLSDDDHAQYALLVGRAGGQLLRGGTASGEDLQLQSTSHSTRGRVIAVDQFTTQSTATKAALQIGAVAGDPSSVADGDVWFNSTTVRFRAREGGVSKNLIGGRAAIWGEYDFDTDTTATDPGSGDVKFNNATPASVTAIYISQTTDAGFNAENLLSALVSGDIIYIQDEGDATKWWRGSVSGAPTDNGAWWTIPVTYVSSGAGGLFSNNEDLTVALMYSGAASGSTLQSAYDSGPTITTTAADGDILFTRGASAAAGDELLHLVDADASASRTAALLFVEDANSGSGPTARFVKSAGTDGALIVEATSARGLVVRDYTNNHDNLVIDTTNDRFGFNRISATTTFAPLFDFHYQSQASNGSFVFDLYSDNGGENFEIIGRKARGTVTTPAGLTDDDDMWELGCYGHNGTTWSPQAAAILFEAAGTWSGTNNGTRQVYKTTLNGATVLREVMVLGDDGCVVVTGGTNSLIGAVSGEFLRVVGNARIQGTVGAFTGTDTNPTAQLSGSTVLLGVGGATTPDVRWRRTAAGISTFDNNTAKRPFIVDATNNRIGGTSIDDAFAPTFDVHFEKNGQFQVGFASYGNYSEIFGQRANGTKASPTVVVNNDILFAITGDGWDGDSFEIGCQVDVQASETWSGTARGSRVVFKTTPNASTTLTERWRVEQSGNLIMSGDLDVTPTTDNQGEIGTASLRFTRGSFVELVATTIGPVAAQQHALPAVTSDTVVLINASQTLANKTLTTPTIASFVNATHNHQNAAGGGTLDHGLALTGLSDDDHAQYAILAGRAGGQLLNGGTAASENLTLISTANATKGKILFGASVLSGYVETTDSWGFGTVSPAVQWDFFQSAPSATLGHLRVRDSVSLFFESDLQNRKVNIYGASATAITDGILNVSSTTVLAILKGNAGGDYSTALRFAGEATDDWLGGYVQYDATGNELIIGTHNTADKLVASDIESIRIVRASGDVLPGVDAGRNFGSSALRWTTLVGNAHQVFAAASDANASVSITSNSIQLGIGGGTALDVALSRGAADRLDLATGDSLNLVSGSILIAATTVINSSRNVVGVNAVAQAWNPDADNTRSIGTSALRWVNVVALNHQVFGTVSDANPTAALISGGVTMGAGGGTAVDLRVSRSAVSTLRIDNNAAGAATVLGGADNTLTIGTAASRLVDVVAITHRVFAAASDANASASLLSGGIALGVGGATALDTRMRRTAAATLTLDNNSTGAVTIVPATDNQNNLGTATLRWSTANMVTANFVNASADANPTVRVDTGGFYLGAGAGSALDCRIRRTAATTITIDNNSTGGVTIVPATTNTGVIGTDSLKWNRVRATSVVTGDLEMKDEAKGVHYVLQEEKDGIYVRDMVKKKMYKIPMVEVPWRN